MAARLIRDDLLDSERVLKCKPETRWLYVSILLQADDVGLFEATPFKLARKADLDRDRADDMVAELVKHDLVRLYSVAGKAYGFVPRFKQRLQIKRAKYPLPPEKLMLDDADALNKIKHLTSNPTVEHGDSPLSTGIHRLNLNLNQKKNKERPPLASLGTPHEGVKAKPAKKVVQGTRLPKPWALPRAWGLWAIEAYPHWTPDTVRAIAATFADHWHSKSGRDASKLDWLATWRNFCRSSIQQRAHPPPTGPQHKTAFTAEREKQGAAWMGEFAPQHRQPDNIIEMEAGSGTPQHEDR